MQPRHKMTAVTMNTKGEVVKHIKDDDLVTDQYFVRQQRRLKYITENVVIGKDDLWYDAGKVGGRARTFLADYYVKEPSILSLLDLNYKLDWGDNNFDVITHFEVIEHLLNPLLAMEECYRILKKGGRMYLTTPNDYSLIYKLEHLLERKYEPHFHQFTRNDLLWLLTSAGFKSVSVREFKRSNTGYIARWCYNSFFVEAGK